MQPAHAPSVLRCSLLTFLLVAPAAAELQSGHTLWASDDVNRTIYHLDLDGTVLSSFASGSISGLAVDPADDTIWAAKEGSNLILNFDRDGNQLSFFFGTVAAPDVSAPEGVAVDYADGTLWFVDDNTLGIYHVQRDGTLISTFQTSAYDPLSISPQAIAADPDGTLWLNDNGTDMNYNITTDGTLLGSFSTGVYSVPANNPQGLSVDETDGTLWVSDRPTHAVYHVQRDGTLIATLDALSWGSNNPTGIAFDRGTKTVDLGSAERFAVLAQRRIVIAGPRSTIEGDVGLGEGGVQRFFGGSIEGTLFRDPETFVARDDAAIAGGTTVEELDDPFADAFSAAAAASRLPPTQRMGCIHRCTTIVGTAGLNVIDIDTIYLECDKRLTLRGTPSSEFVLNVSGCLVLSYSSIELQGGVLPGNVTINVEGRGTEVLLLRGSAPGTILARGRAIILARHSTVVGSLISGRQVQVLSGSQVRSDD